MPWLEERLKVSGLVSLLSGKTVPRHRHSFWYLFGGLALFFFIVQIVTGVLLLVYYSPTPASANESVHHIVNEAPFGWLIRTIHSWSANLMIATVLIHLFSTYFLRAYRKPREMMWLSGVFLLFLVLGFGFTGYLLPWDSTAYFATQIGTEIPRSTPVVGELVVRLLRGGEYIAEESLKRLFALHVVVLPLLALGLVGFHLTMSQVHGSSVPIGTTPKHPPIRFYPNYLFRDALAWLCGLMLLLWLSLLFPVDIGPKVNPLESAPAGIKPVWYFLPLYQTLRMAPSTILGLNSEMVVNLFVMLLGFFLVSIPFLDRSSESGKRVVLFPVVGLVAVVYLSVTITLAYLT